MSEFQFSLNNSQIISLQLLFVKICSIAIYLCPISNKNYARFVQMDQISVAQPKMSRFWQNNVRDPRSQDPDFLAAKQALHIEISGAH